jgi:hypothetical protein
VLGHQRPPPKTIRDYVEGWKAELILIIRDPDHVVHSIRRRGGHTADIARYRWAEAIVTISKLVKEYPQHTYLVEFEDLVVHPESTTEGLCSFLGLTYNERMLRGYEGTPQYDRDRIVSSVATKAVPSADMVQHYPEVVEMYKKLVRNRKTDNGDSRRVDVDPDERELLS